MSGNVYKWVYNHQNNNNKENTNNLNVIKKINDNVINTNDEQKEQHDDGSMDVDEDEDEAPNQESESIAMEQPKSNEEPQQIEQEQKETTIMEQDDNVNQELNENEVVENNKKEEKEKKEEEHKEEEPAKPSPNKNKIKTKFEEDSDEDFDIDMDEEPSPKKKILRRSFIDDEDESPSPPIQINANTKINTSISPEAKPTESKTENKAKLQAELAAAAEMFGDDDNLFNDDNNNNDKDEAKPKQTPKVQPKPSIFSKNIFEDEEAEDLGVDTKKEKNEERMMDQDTGEDLKDFIVDPENENNPSPIERARGKEDDVMDDMYDEHSPRSKHNQLKVGGKEDDIMDDMYDEHSPRSKHNHRSTNKVIYQQKVHKAFTNGSTKYDEDGQRYLLFNEIGAVIARKQDVSSNPMEMNNIMSSLSSTKYSYEIEFFDKSRFTRAVVIKSDHHFTSCDVNSYGLLLGSTPQKPTDIVMNDGYDIDEPKDNDEDIIKESIIRYKPISRNNEYRTFSSEKDCEWTYTLPIGEECVSVGLTRKYALIATNKRDLRILSIGGLQTHQIIPLSKTVINIASNMKNIVVITFEDLSFIVIDLDDTNNNSFEGKMCITDNNSTLSRIFMIGQNSKEWRIITIDSSNKVCMLTNNIMNNAVLLDLNEYLNKKYPMNDETITISNNMRPKGIWPVYFDMDEQCLMVVELKYLETPIPSQSTNDGFVLEDYKISIPLLNMGQNQIDPMTQDEIIMFGNREEEIMRKDLLYKLNGDDGKEKEHNKQKLKDYLMLFSHSCKSNKAVMAYDMKKNIINRN
eukprot:CAMPEP_0201593088 /NCGR_PEP_ID=MMETSP0190_2-20130828/190805_1 /ASSEMBLY_ACC=CAM_ASM_000263 /TAXON_ID=37353 /ORGANISM="Rosalina sp." /LENGTH=799 /DNA_ID=CAMNT_0048052159 /DNA_START=964 /DNA_END=3363 /DNA_ORIENTATION=+